MENRDSGVCDHCGKCCLSGIPCYFGQILFNITEINPQPCPSAEHDEYGKIWCGLISNPLKWFPPMVGNIEWKCKAMADIASIYIGIGQGCGNNPTAQEIMTKCENLASRLAHYEERETSDMENSIVNSIQLIHGSNGHGTAGQLAGIFDKGSE